MLDMARSIEERLKHRGPDESSLVDIPHGVLVSCRLAITDPAGSHQPLRGCGPNLSVVFSGEIYNFRELRAELAASGHQLRTNGDGEVIAHLYEQVGIRMLDRLRGAFAIALYDHGADTLILARDRLGEKPLLFGQNGDVVTFASECRALLPYVDTDVDREAFEGYVRFGHFPEPSTPLIGVKKVPAGGYIVLDRQISSPIKSDSYWSLPRPAAYPGTSASRLADVTHAFSDAVRQQTPSDVPGAIALSDGIDSTLIAHAAAQHCTDLRAYSVAFDWMDDRAQQSDVAAATAKELGLSHQIVSLTESRYQDLLVEGATSMSEPVADWTMPAYLGLVDQCRQDGVRVLLTGHGADELLLAYDWTQRALRNDPRVNHAFAEAYAFNAEYREGQEFLRSIRTGNVVSANAESQRPGTTGGRGAYRALREKLLSGYLRSNGLMQLDSLGLLREVEVRLPFVDYLVVEAIIAADPDQQASDRPKRLLYELAGSIGLHHASRPKKPFFPDLLTIQSPVIGLAQDVLPHGRLVHFELLEIAAVSSLVRSAQSGRFINVLLRLLVIELWLRNVDQAIAPAASQ